MIKKFIILISFLSFLSVMYFSCSSFTYDDPENKVRAMNFDYSGNPEIKLSYLNSSENEVFTLSFDTKLSIGYAYMLGVNDQNIFTCTQMLSRVALKPSRGKKIFIHDVFLDTLRYANSVDYVEKTIKGKKVTHSPGFYTHILISDFSGNTSILEMSPEKNELVKKTGDAMVMTNFRLYPFDYKDVQNIYGPGADRYIAMWNKIEEIKPIDSLDKALSILDSSKNYLTCSSAVFFPEEKTIYLCFDGNFDRIWKILPFEKTVETFMGFEENRKEMIDSDGILKSELLSWK